MATIAELEQQIQTLTTQLTDLSGQLEIVVNKVKEEKVVKSVTFEVEGDEIKARAKIIYKRGAQVEEQWEDFTEKFTKEQKEAIINVA